MPIRYGRMLRSPFTFLRGSAPLMADDLATTPTTGIRVQACGDCHLLNFGLFATPERHLVFDVHDFDETHPAPWESDLKRLVVSFAIAARENRLSDTAAQEVAVACVRAYRGHLRERVQEGMSAYRQSLFDERRVLLDRSAWTTSAPKVAVIAASGPAAKAGCWSPEGDHPLILQFKEAGRLCPSNPTPIGAPTTIRGSASSWDSS